MGFGEIFLRKNFFAKKIFINPINQLIIIVIIVIIVIILLLGIFSKQKIENSDHRERRSPSKSDSKKDRIVGSWTLTRTGGTPRDLSSQGTVLFHSDGTTSFNFASFLGVPSPNRPAVLGVPSTGIWKKVGHNRYSIFVHTLIATPTTDPDYAQLSLFPAGNTIRVTCAGDLALSPDGKTFTSITGSDQCNFYQVTDLDLSTPIAPSNTGEAYIGVKIG